MNQPNNGLIFMKTIGNGFGIMVLISTLISIEVAHASVSENIRQFIRKNSPNESKRAIKLSITHKY